MGRLAVPEEEKVLTAEDENCYTSGSYWSLYRNIWYKLFESMDLISIDHTYSPRLNQFELN